mmetsp:Transcript_16303/g.38585  ORF Transcript_16303/g.38585 Transcript_16303/m.38585 type:complete len:83 (-) Transcript_16303:314-562(-)
MLCFAPPPKPAHACGCTFEGREGVHVSLTGAADSMPRCYRRALPGSLFDAGSVASSSGSRLRADMQLSSRMKERPSLGSSEM